MIEITIREYLAGALDGVPVFLELPQVPSDAYAEWPTEFVLIEKVGGGQTNHIDSASFAIQSYSTESLYNAAALDKQVRTAMPGIVAEDSVSSCRLASSYNFTDTATKKYRYQSTFDLTIYD